MNKRASKKAAYSTFPIDDQESECEPSDNERCRWVNRRWTFIGSAIGLSASLLSFSLFWMHRSFRRHGEAISVPLRHSDSPSNSELPMPYGVNLASWLSLEDYFFVGDRGAEEVATPDGKVAAICLPPIHTTKDVTGPAWNSETDLFINLARQHSVGYAIRVFHAFRTTFIDFDQDLSQIAGQGIRNVRVPVSWCLTDHDPAEDALLMQTEGTSDKSSDPNDDILLERFTCRDPLYERHGASIYWPAVPKSLLVQFLRSCNKCGIQATLDIHTNIGGTSLGTFSGVWPRAPLFWKYDDPENSQDLGRSIWKSWIDWIESLSDSDPEAFSAIGGITPMNEPAHLAGLFGPGSVNPDEKGFLPTLPNRVAERYLSTLDASVPDGAHLRVLLWQSDAVAAFRESTLPSKGVNLVVNLHESIFVPSLVSSDAMDPGATHPAATGILARWWQTVTTAEERSSWAILDMHHYHAWEKACQGSSVSAEGSYACGNYEETEAVLKRCTGWAGVYRSSFANRTDRQLVPKLYSGEFSASTFHSVLRSCIDISSLRMSYLAQIDAAREADVKLFWWSWKMAYGGAFRSAWSFQQLMYLLNARGFVKPDTSIVPCGE